MKIVYFQVLVRSSSKKIDLSLDELRKAPCHQINFYEFDKFMVSFEYNPLRTTNLEALERNFIKTIKRNYSNVIEITKMDQVQQLKK